ncbi:MAG: cation:proton antiporter [Candidatus Methanoperedens sp.]|nr:cation:proton antiporter [Candidatus Methanoperedens sp.]CAG0993776.1 Na(+)/H(+)-K(+) antiporter GerN [Methanosarcinales archaeon]
MRWYIIVLFIILLLAPTALASEAVGTIDIPHIVLSLAIMLLVAKLGGEIAERKFKQPGVLGELLAGVVISPFAFGPYLGFNPIPGEIMPISPEIDLIGQIGVVVLLFLAGIETDVKQFMKFGKVAGFVAAGGVIVPFVLGYFAIKMFYTPPADEPIEYVALFTGAILTATSVGITARVLKDINRMNSEEGTTILGAAVIDDILGIIVLAMVIGVIGTATGATQLNFIDNAWNNVVGKSTMTDIIWIILKAAMFWALVLFIGLKYSDKISDLLSKFETKGALMVIALVIGFVISYLAAYIGLALIIGAYAAGLALSASRHREHLIEEITPVFNFLVPIFFVAMGMLVNVKEAITIAGLGVLILVLAIIGKAFGCGIVSYFSGFNYNGAIRVGTGMIPRGEVGLIVAYIGLSQGIIQQPIYVIAVVMSIVTTLITPPLLKSAFAKGPEKGWKGKI